MRLGQAARRVLARDLLYLGAGTLGFGAASGLIWLMAYLAPVLR